ncbi:unnamed protein product [Acanthoscelides obtectus]|uniref:Uncharacterized protein n=1 Tax=Acanthoscelides obtectus TaxID=200917 RepID=A0A9P0QD86_ACAOB|nr:unnamed protein product [Acanthoscelides obtectus]CAK1682697.1 hypothetical protein AOBTE_LOCUS33803 [Acanthoscelides obtectus]
MNPCANLLMFLPFALSICEEEDNSIMQSKYKEQTSRSCSQTLFKSHFTTPERNQQVFRPQFNNNFRPRPPFQFNPFNRFSGQPQNHFRTNNHFRPFNPNTQYRVQNNFQTPRNNSNQSTPMSLKV